MTRYFLPELADSLDQEELDELHDALYARNGDSGPLLDGLHGLISALLVGPGQLDPEEWLPLVLNTETPWSSHLEADHLRNQCLRLYLATERGLEQLAYEPILAEYDEDDEDDGEADENDARVEPAVISSNDDDGDGSQTVIDASGWCTGFAIGIEMFAHLWEPRMRNDPQLGEIMAPIMALAFSEGMFENFSDPQWPPLSDAERDTCVQMIPSCVIDLQHYWRDHPPEDDDAETGAAGAGRARPRKRGGRWLH